MRENNDEKIQPNDDEQVRKLRAEARDYLERAVILGKATDRSELSPEELAIHDTTTAEAEHKLKLFDSDPIQFMKTIRSEMNNQN